jgi:hypothetical protein
MKINLDLKDKKPKRKNIWDLFWHLIRVHNEINSLTGFKRENFSCEHYNLLPSSELRKRYNLNYEYSDPLVWWLLENYFNGNLVLKEKENAN